MHRIGVLLLFSASLCAQEFRATITGRLTDSSNSVIPNAVLQVRNVETNEVASTVTDTQGNYTVPFLKPGTYSISTEVPGFKKFTREGLVLMISQAATVNIALEVGAVTEQVTVTAETPLLETAKADRGSVVDGLRVRELPLNFRNPFMLSAIVAGVFFNGNAIYHRPFDNGAIAEWTINGSRTRSNEFLLDGAPNNAQAGGNNIAYVPPVDAVEEFKIQTNSYDAQYGHTGGGIVNVSLKSGTNNFHGTAYNFMRRNGWDANSFQNNARGAPRDGHFLDQYGFVVEGPIRIPKLYDGRDKSFYMIAYEGYREGTPNPLNLSVPQPEMRDGDFSKLVDARGQPITIFDPTTGRDINGVWTRQPFEGNRIPANRINPIARRILEFMPQPNTVTAGAAYSSNNLFIPGGQNVARDDYYNLVFKFDQNIRDRHRMFFRHASNDRTEYRNTNGVYKKPGEDGPTPLKRVNDAYVFDWVGTVSPTFLLNVRSSFSRYIEGSRGDASLGFDKTTLGFPASLVGQLPHGAFFGRYEFDGYINLGRYSSFNITNTFALHPTFTKIRGGHTLKAGVDMRWIQYSTQNMGNPFMLRAERNFTRREYNRADATSGNSIATWLLGSLTSATLDYNVFPIFLYRYYAPWFQDDWKVTPRLTLNLGLRWDLNTPPNERYNRLNRSFDKDAVSPADSLIDRRRFPDVPQLRGGLLFSGVNGIPRDAADSDKNNIQGRVGVAYQISSKLVARGGWGRLYSNPNNDYIQTTGYSQSTPFLASPDSNRTAHPNTINNPWPNGVSVPPGSALGLSTFLGRTFSFVNPDFSIPYVDQFSLGFQYELPMQSRVEISYVGSRTRDLQTSKDFNLIDVPMRERCNLMEGGNPLFCDALLPNPFQGLAPFEGTNHFANATLSRGQLTRPYPHFGGTLTERTRNDGAIFYNSMQVTWETRSRRGWNLIATYTLSKQVWREGFLDTQRGVMNQGLTAWDRPHKFYVASVYDLPFGKGKRWGSTSHPVWSRLLSGWENTVMFRAQSGTPWEMHADVIYIKEAKIDNIDWSAHQVYGVRPCVARWNDNGSITMQTFSRQAGCTDYNFLIKPRNSPRFSTLRDGRLRLHAIPQADISFNKTTRITESTSLQFRAEAFNVLNTYLFYAANFTNNPEDANFGSILKSTVGFTSTSFPRHVQLAVKFIW